MKRKKKLILMICIPVLAIGIILYILADRYLIEHIEAVIPSTPEAGGTQSTADSRNTITAENGPQESTADSTSAENITGDNSTEENSTEENAVIGDLSYKSKNKTILIRKVETGSGSEIVTYYVADITLKDVSSLQTAFAKNEFGRNIVQNTSEIAAYNNAILAINGDYYGFRKDGVIIRNGVLYRDIPARDAFVLYRSGTMKNYSEFEVPSDKLMKDGAADTFSFGPALVKDGTAVVNFGKVEIDKNIGYSSIEGLNPRTGIGMISANHFIFIIVDGRMPGYSIGMSLKDFAQLFKDLGCSEAYNLDGGGSATMYFMGKVVNNPLGKGQERGVSDIIYIK